MSKEKQIISPMEELVLTPEQKEARMKEKISKFIEGLKNLEKEHGISLVAILNYSSDGIKPAFTFIEPK